VTRLRIGTSIWLDRYSGRRPEFPALVGSHDADIAIVGGGIDGAAAILTPGNAQVDPFRAALALAGFAFNRASR
jgi:hypothetical protein